MSSEASVTPIEVELDAQFGAYVAANQAPGLAYGIVTKEGLVHSAGFGRANDTGAVPDENTPFPIASMSKSFTAAALCLVRDRGLISLEDPITRYIPQFAASGAPDGDVDPPSVRMLISMSGGLTEDNSWVDPQVGITEEELLAIVAKGLKYSHEPGTLYEYSNIGYTLGGLVVERVTGQQIEEFVTSELLVPLGMTSSSFSPSTYDNSLRAWGYSLDPADNWRPYPIAESGAFAAAGGMVSTVHDLAIWITWLGESFRPGQSSVADVLSRASRREMQRLETIMPPLISRRPDSAWQTAVAGYGLGLVIDYDLYRGISVSHSGGLPGYLLHMRWHPRSGDGIICLTNSHRGNPIALAGDAHHKLMASRRTPSATIVLWPETVRARIDTEALIREWTQERADALFAENVEFDRPIAGRRAEVESFIELIGPLKPALPVTEVVSVATPADVTWSIPGEHGEIIAYIHMTPLDPPKVQEFTVVAVPSDVPRSAAPCDISPRRADIGEASLSEAPNVRVVVPETG